jgi:hypothetical protein
MRIYIHAERKDDPQLVEQLARDIHSHIAAVDESLHHRTHHVSVEVHYPSGKWVKCSP